MRNTKPIAFSMTVREQELLRDAAQKTGLPQAEIVRRLIYAYTSGLEIPGLPKYDTARNRG